MTGSVSGSGREETQQAIVCLPPRQREALRLLELEQLSYEEIATSMGASRGSVAQLIARARINLYDELHGTPLASVAAPSPECERSLPLIAAREDGQLDPASDGDAAWLNAHLAGCDRCRPAVEQMTAAAASYRAWAAPGAPAGAPTAQPPAPGGVRRRRRTIALVATSFVVVLLVGLAVGLVGDGDAPAPADPAAEIATPRAREGESSSRARIADAGATEGAARKKSKTAGQGTKASAEQGTTGEVAAGETAPNSISNPAPHAASGGSPSEHPSGPDRSSGQTAVGPPKQASTPKPGSKPKPAPTSTQASQPSPAPSPPEAPPPEASPEEAPDSPGRSGEAPGKPADRPPR